MLNTNCLFAFSTMRRDQDFWILASTFPQQSVVGVRYLRGNGGTQVRTMDWKPNEDLIKWGNEHFKALSAKPMWTPQDSGVQFMKTWKDAFNSYSCTTIQLL